MLDLFLQLIDRCMQLANQRVEQNRVLFGECVQPIMSDFEKLHKDYIESFKRYRALIKETATPLNEDNPIFETIHEDMIFSEDARSRIFGLVWMGENEKTGGLIDALLQYLDSSLVEKYGIGIKCTNIVREGLRSRLAWITEEELDDDARRARMIEAIDEVVLETQARYRKVIEEFFGLKGELLNHR